MKMATSPIEPVAVMTMTWRIVEPVTNLAVLPLEPSRERAVRGGQSITGMSSAVGGLGDLSALALLVDALGFAASA